MSLWLVLNITKWTLSLLSGVPNIILAWKLWDRKHLHTVFNLSMCYFFFWSGLLAPLLITGYFNLLEARMQDPGQTCLELCRQMLLVRVVLYQLHKVFIANILYR